MGTGLLQFLLDGTLTGLARNLRLMGFDTEVATIESSSVDLIDRARDEFRILVTSNRQVSEKCVLAGSPRSLYISQEGPKEEVQTLVRQLLKSIPEALAVVQNENFFFCRCIHCNSRLLPISREMAESRVPAETLSNSQHFQICPRCERVTWDGPHQEKLRLWIRKIID